MQVALPLRNILTYYNFKYGSTNLGMNFLKAFGAFICWYRTYLGNIIGWKEAIKVQCVMMQSRLASFWVQRAPSQWWQISQCTRRESPLMTELWYRGGATCRTTLFCTLLLETDFAQSSFKLFFIGGFMLQNNVSDYLLQCDIYSSPCGGILYVHVIFLTKESVGILLEYLFKHNVLF